MRTEQVELKISGMTCDGCAEHVQRALEGVAGAYNVVVPAWEQGKASLAVDESTTDDVLAKAVAAAGYGAQVVSRTPLAEQVDAVRPGEAEVDLIIIGAGSAAFAAAIRASELGYSVTMVERSTLGGTCVNVGCVPSKTLLRTAESFYQATHSRFASVRPGGADLDWGAVIDEKDELVNRLRREKYEQVLEAYPSIELIRGEGSLTPEANVVVNGHTYHPARVLIATGAHPYVPPFPGVDGVDVLTSTAAFELAEQPESLVVLGGRYVALEVGLIFARLGTRVTLLQRSDRILPEHEPEIGDALKGYLTDEGIEIYTGVDVLRLRRDGSEKVVEARVGGEARSFRATHLLAATGRRPNTDGLGLKAAGIDVDEHRGAIVVDAGMRTANGRVYAAGDVTGPPMLVYIAAAEGKRAAENALLGQTQPLERSVIPAVVFTDPQVATVGLTEAQARAQGIAVKTAILPLSYVPRALAARDTRGLVKLVADASTGHLVGAHVLAAEAGEVIQTATMALRGGMRVRDLTETLFPYLTQVESLKRAALSFDRDVALLSCCAG